MGLIFEYNDNEFRFNDTSTHENHLRQNGILTWFCNEMASMTMFEYRMSSYGQNISSVFIYLKFST